MREEGKSGKTEEQPEKEKENQRWIAQLNKIQQGDCYSIPLFLSFSGLKEFFCVSALSPLLIC